MNLTKKGVAVIAILCMVCSSVFAGVVIQMGKGTNVYGGRFFEASIVPSNVSLVVGQVQNFTVHYSDAVEPLNYSWTYFTPVNVSVSVNGVQAWWNGSGTFDAGNSFSFSFLTACAGLRLSVHVVDNDPSSPLYGGCGDASASVFDPYAAPSVYLDAFPIATVVETDGAGWYRYTTNGKLMFSSTNASAVFSNVYGNNSHLVHVVFGTYSLTNWISPCENSVTYGDGWGTVLYLASGADTNVIRFTGISANNVVIRDLAIDGNKAGQSAPSWRDMRSGIYSGNYSGYQVGTITNNLRLYNLYIHDLYCGAGVRLVMSDNIAISDCKFVDNGFSSTYSCDAVFIGNSTNPKITNLEATNCLDTAIALCNVQHSTVVGTRAINCGAGIAIVNEYPPSGVNTSLLCNYNTIIGGFIQNCSWGSAGVNVQSYVSDLPDHTTISGIHLLNNTYNVANEGSNTHLTGGCTLGMSTLAAGMKNVWILGGTMSITGCSILDADVGIETVNPTYQLEVSGCTFTPATLTYPLNLSAAVTDLNIHGNNGLIDQVGADSLVSSYSYLVYTNGASYFMRNGSTGRVDFSSANASQVINFASGNLTSERTWYEKILLKGNFTCDSPIQLGNWTELCGPATIYMAAGTRTNIIQNVDRTSIGNHHIYVHDLTFHGLYEDWSGQGNAVDLYNPTYIGGNLVKPYCVLERLNFYEISNRSISLYGLGASIVKGIIEGNGYAGIRLNKVYDSDFEDINVYGQTHYGLEMVGATTSNHLTDVYLGGEPDIGYPQLYMYDADYNIFKGLRCDNQRDLAIYMADGSDYNQLNFMITQVSVSANATYNAVNLTLGSHNCLVGEICRQNSATYCKYAILEGAGSDYNYISVNVGDSSKYGIVTVGANTQVHLCWNCSDTAKYTWVP